MRALAPLPCPIDLFVPTSDEVGRARDEHEPLVRVALTEGIDLP